MFCAGSRSVNNQRVISGLVLTIGSIDCIIDNTASFVGMGSTNGGVVITFGEFPVYVAVAAKEYPEEVFTCLAPSIFDASACSDYASFGRRISGDADRDDTEPSIYAEVHVVEHVTAGGGVAKTLRETEGPSQL